MKSCSGRGFTLIELMVVVAVIAILAAIGYPSYQNHVSKSRRVAAQSQMLDLANRQQQYLMSARQYADTAAMAATGYTLPSEVSPFYTYSLQVSASPAYTITFTPIGSQVNDGTLTLDHLGTKLPAGKW